MHTFMTLRRVSFQMQHAKGRMFDVSLWSLLGHDFPLSATGSKGSYVLYKRTIPLFGGIGHILRGRWQIETRVQLVSLSV